MIINDSCHRGIREYCQSALFRHPSIRRIAKQLKTAQTNLRGTRHPIRRMDKAYPWSPWKPMLPLLDWWLRTMRSMPFLAQNCVIIIILIIIIISSSSSSRSSSSRSLLFIVFTCSCYAPARAPAFSHKTRGYRRKKHGTPICVYIYIYVHEYIYIYIYICTYIYIYI